MTSKSTNQRGSAVTGIIVFLVILAAFAFITSIRVVGTGKIGVVTNYGRVTGRELSEGVSLVAPFWIETVKRYDIKTQKLETTDVAAATLDLQDANATVVLNFKLQPGKVKEIHQTVGPKYKENIVNPAIEELFKASTAKFTAKQLIQERDKAKADITKLLQERLEKYGIIIQDVSLTNFSFSEAFNAAVEATATSQQQIAQLQAELEKAKVEAEKVEVNAKAQAEAQRLQQETLTPALLQKMWIEKWNGQLPTTQAGEGAQLYIPTSK